MVSIALSFHVYHDTDPNILNIGLREKRKNANAATFTSVVPNSSQ